MPTSNVVITSCSVGGRRRLLQAGGASITITLQIRKQGTRDSATKAAEAVVDLINGGDLEKEFAAKGIDYKPKDAESNTKDPIKWVAGLRGALQGGAMATEACHATIAQKCSC